MTKVDLDLLTLTMGDSGYGSQVVDGSVSWLYASITITSLSALCDESFLQTDCTTTFKSSTPSTLSPKK